jgi:hypothetical protein
MFEDFPPGDLTLVTLLVGVAKGSSLQVTGVDRRKSEKGRDEAGGSVVFKV